MRRKYDPTTGRRQRCNPNEVGAAPTWDGEVPHSARAVALYSVPGAVLKANEPPGLSYRENLSSSAQNASARIGSRPGDVSSKFAVFH